MALTLIGRWNLGGGPFDPAMQDEGVLIYRSSAATVRKAVWNVSDAFLGTINNPGGHALPYFGNAEIFGDYYYPPFRNAPYATPWISAIHTGTGALTEFSTAPLSWGSYQMRAHVFKNNLKTAQMSLALPVPANNASSIWGNTPPVAATFTGGSAPSGDMSTVMPATVPVINVAGLESVFIFGDRITPDAFVHYHQAYRYTWNGLNIALSYIPRFSYVYFLKGIAGFTMSPIQDPSRMMVADGKLWFFQKRSDSNSIWLSEMNMNDLPNTAYANQNWTLTTIGISGGVGVNTPWTMAFHIDADFNKIYTTNPAAATSGPFPRPNDLYSAFLPWTNPEIYVLPDAISTTNARITGIWSFPPYIYITKMAGGTFGNQLIKFYDPDMAKRNLYLGRKPSIRMYK
jgi:hypothetical protein